VEVQMSARRSTALWLASWIVAGVVGLAIAFLTRPQIASAQAALPDLIVDDAYLDSSVTFSSRNFKPNDCAVQEGCVGANGRRKLLRFATATPNIGSADVFLGAPQDHPELFVFSPCHQHYHLDGYASYELLDSTGQLVLRGRKQAFCLMDENQYSPDAGPRKYDCTNQGISVGWEDVYGSDLDCQWLDVTQVPPGNYLLRITVNPQRADGTYLLSESDHSNNVAVVPVTIPRHF
jgi:hypothetical protein